jgi:hypothetical protein
MFKLWTEIQEHEILNEETEKLEKKKFIVFLMQKGDDIRNCGFTDDCFDDENLDNICCPYLKACIEKLASHFIPSITNHQTDLISQIYCLNLKLENQINNKEV